MSSLRQAAANQRNAQKSTGPRTEEGKTQSRQNGVTHGLTTTAFVPAEFAEAFETRRAAWKPTFAPADDWQDFELNQVVLTSIRLEHCQSSDMQRRVELTAIANEPSPKWELARQHEAVRLGESLKRNPERVAIELRLTSAGRDWMIRRWEYLLIAVTQTGENTWTDVQTQEVLDLQGLPREHRNTMTQVLEQFQYPQRIREVILVELKRLTAEHTHRLQEMGDLRQKHAEGFKLEEDAALKRIKRYEADAYRRYIHARKSLATLKSAGSITPLAAPAPHPVPDANAEVAPTLTVEITEPVTVDTSSAPVPKGNRRQRRKQEAQVRHHAHHERAKANRPG